MISDADARSTGLERDIDRTRHQMDRTIDELVDRLNPKYLLRQYFGAFTGGVATGAARDFGTRSWQAIRNHPIPSALISAGLVWLSYEGGAAVTRLFGAHRQSSRANDYLSAEVQEGMYSGSYVDARTGEPYAAETQASEQSYGMPAEPYEQESMREGSGRLRESVSRMRDKAGNLISGARERTIQAGRSATQRVQEAASSVSEKAKGAASQTAEQLRQAARSAGQGIQQGAAVVGQRVQQGYSASRDAVVKTADENPLSTGIGLLALGALVGVALPRSRAESRMMGHASQQAYEKAKARGRELLDRGRRVASVAANTAAEEARAQGLTPDALTQKAKSVAREARDAATQAAEQEGGMQNQHREEAPGA